MWGIAKQHHQGRLWSTACSAKHYNRLFTSAGTWEYLCSYSSSCWYSVSFQETTRIYKLPEIGKITHMRKQCMPGSLFFVSLHTIKKNLASRLMSCILRWQCIYTGALHTCTHALISLWTTEIHNLWSLTCECFMHSNGSRDQSRCLYTCIIFPHHPIILMVLTKRVTADLQKSIIILFVVLQQFKLS